MPHGLVHESEEKLCALFAHGDPVSDWTILEEAVLTTALVAMKDVKKTSFRELTTERTVLYVMYTVFPVN